MSLQKSQPIRLNELIAVKQKERFYLKQRNRERSCSGS